MANKDDVGMCTACFEHTSLGDPCCGAPVSFEGSTYSWEDFEEDSEGAEERYPDRQNQIYQDLKREGY